MKDLEELRQAHVEDQRIIEELRREEQRDAPLELLLRLKRFEECSVRPERGRTKAPHGDRSTEF